jgi:hypothetical protein
MAHFYFDESIQERGAFIVGAYVYGPNAEGPVSAALAQVGLQPGVDEFKSSSRMSGHPEQVKLREELQLIVRDYRVGVLVALLADRASLGQFALQGLDQIAQANRLVGRPDEAARVAAALGVNVYCQVRPEQDSRAIKGLQIADLVAHTAGLMLLDSLGLLKKVVKAGVNSGYDEDHEIELGFEMWASLRYQFFNSGPVVEQDEIYRGALVQVDRNGLFVAPSCSDDLRAAAERRFAQWYLGCIH